MQQNTIHSTFVIERSYPVAPERVFAAFSEPARKRMWFAGSPGRSAEEFEMDFRVGGTERTRSRPSGGPMAGVLFTNDTVYLDIVSNRRIVFAYTMSAGSNRISASLITVEFLPAEAGTDLIFTEQAAFFEGADGPQMREQGWSKLLDNVTSELNCP